MSSGSVQEESVSATSPAESDSVNLYELLSEKVDFVGKVVSWIGLLTGLWFMLGAYKANGDVSGIESVGDLIPEWHDWVWIGAAGIGIIISFIVCAYLTRIRKPNDLPYDLLAAVGGAISLAVVVVMLLEYIDAIHSLVSPDTGVLWPGAKPLWFMPLSALGITMPMVALVLVRRDDIRDEALGVFLSCVPVIVMSLPFALSLDSADMVRWVPTLYFVSGIGLMIAGLKPFNRSSRIMLEPMEYYVPRILAAVLVTLGVVSFFVVSSGDDLSSSMDFIWILPLAISLIMSVAVMLAVRNAAADDLAWTHSQKASTRKWMPLLFQGLLITSVLMSLVLLSLFTLVYLDVVAYEPGHALYALSLPRNVWLYPLSLLGTTLVMMAISLAGKGTPIDRLGGVLYASVPAVVTLCFAAAWEMYSKSDTAYPLLSGQTGMLVYFGFAAAVLVSGMKIETFIKMQLPVLREKSALNRKKYREVMRLVMRNVMGVIGIVILIIFIVIAFIGPYIAPYEVDMTINGQFDNLMPESSEHLMGTDPFGHDVFSQLLYGAKTSITVGIVAALISSFLGAAIGLYSGYVGGWKDEAIMRLNDIVLSIPWLVLMIIIAAFMGSIDLTGIILVIGLTGWSGTARLVRAQVLSLRERQYIERARAIGSTDMHIIRTHILPNAFPLVFANTILTVAGSILAEATLSFLQLEPQGVVTWGTMLADAQEAGAFTIGLHWWIVAPGLCIVVVVLGFTLLGYALDDVMNPKLRKR